ncbi:1-deoxy-D-xylulose-5-phosphate reductoisomerase, partial [bacterium]|nr:1-deoxy-D-xylulose-5-phosphate reductoisomerase [bacterium]
TNCQIVPLDSEHQSLYQLLKQVDRASVSKVTITGSGGPFLHTPVMNLAEVTPEQAIAHPRWKMGPKISTDSATMFNKALELVEAHYLFDLPAEKIAVLIHPQSVVHGLVDLDSGESHAALAPADMRVPITNALTELVKEDTNHGAAQRKASQLVSGVTACELTKVGKLEFFAPDFERFPALKLGYEVIRQGEGYPIVLNAANEIAVASFLGQQLKFTQIAKIVEETLARYHGRKILTLEDIYEVDAWARSQASNLTVTH